MKLSNKEVGKLTLKQFNHLYQIYKDDFDLELMLRLNRMTYRQLKEKSLSEQEWI